jgi:predicted amidohydrolase YtcJ
VGDTIRGLGPSRAVQVPAGAEVVDLAGKAVLPGLWDMHAHLEPGDGVLDLASGVTTVRDVGNHPDTVDDLKARFDAGTAIGPHILRAGIVEGRGENASASDVTATTEEEAKAAVEFYAKRGYEQMKIYNSIKPELVPLFTREAHARGMTVTGHIPWRMLAHEAVDAGYDGIEHINMLFLNFFADHTTETRTTKRFSLVGDHAADLDLASRPVQDFLAQLHKHHTVVDPTLVAFEGMFVTRPGQVTPGMEELVARLPIFAQRHFREGGLPMEGKEELYARSWTKVLAMVRALHEAHVPVVVGTDEVQGLTLHHELRLYARAGIKPADALHDDTLEAAHAMKLEKKTGSIAPGKAADLYVVDGDPLAHIEDVRKGVETVRSGVVFVSKDLYEAAGVKP